MEEDRRVFLVDTPGFGNSITTDRDQLRRTSEWLTQRLAASAFLLKFSSLHARSRGVNGDAIAGVIYLQMIDERMTLDSPRVVKNLETFQKFLDASCALVIRIITTHWREKSSTRYKQSQDLHNQFLTRLRSLVESGARMARLEYNHGHTPFPGNAIRPEDARNILYGMFNPLIM
jgi:hypothetical protein